MLPVWLLFSATEQAMTAQHVDAEVSDFVQRMPQFPATSLRDTAVRTVLIIEGHLRSSHRLVGALSSHDFTEDQSATLDALRRALAPFHEVLVDLLFWRQPENVSFCASRWHQFWSVWRAGRDIVG